MKRFTYALTVLAASLALATPSAAAPEKTQFRGSTATADVYQFDEASCISTAAYIFVTESRYKYSSASSTESAYASVSLSQYNDCTSTEPVCVYGSVELPNGAFDIHGNLQSATLNTTINGYDCYTGEPAAIAVNLTWTGDGDVFNGRSNSSYSYPGYRFSYRSQGQNRYATVSGSVSSGGVTLNPASSATYTYVFGNLTDAHSGSMIRYE